MSVRPRLALGLLIAAFISGCATPARMEEMASYSPRQAVNPALKANVGVLDVTGGRETNPMWMSQVSTDAFRRALELSLEAAGLHNKLVSGSKYQLTADMTRLDQPLLGFDMTVASTVRYSLIETATRKEVYSRVIQVSYTAKMSDAFIGSERLRLANEGAVKTNIQALIGDLMILKLP